jgi:hypothetical protein
MGFALSWIRIGSKGGVCQSCGMKLRFKREGFSVVGLGLLCLG